MDIHGFTDDHESSSSTESYLEKRLTADLEYDLEKIFNFSVL